MPSIKVLPVAPDDVGLVHPVDGPLAVDGSSWTLDAFTMRRLDESVIRRFEAGVDDAKGATPAEGAAAPPEPAAAAPGVPAPETAPPAPKTQPAGSTAAGKP